MNEKQRNFMYSITIVVQWVIFLLPIVILFHVVNGTIEDQQINKYCEYAFNQDYKYNYNFKHPECVLKVWESDKQEYVVFDSKPIPPHVIQEIKQ